MPYNSFRRCSLAIGLCVLAAAPLAFADSESRTHKKRDHGEPEVQQDQIRDALKKGEIRPLAEITAAAETAVPGQIVGVKVKVRKDRLVYEFKIIADKGRVREVYVDAASLDIVKVE